MNLNSVDTVVVSRVAPQLLTTSNFIGPWFTGLGSIVLLFGVLFSQQIKEDLVRAATSPSFKVNRKGYLLTRDFLFLSSSLTTAQDFYSKIFIINSETIFLFLIPDSG